MKQQPLLPSSFVILFSSFLLLTNLYTEFCNARYTITSSQFIRDPEYIVSNGSMFRLGFFSPVNSTNRYVGIWYNNINMTTIVWVANRDKPVNDSSGVLEIYEDGNLVISNGRKEILWSSNVSSGVNSSIAVLTNEGNLVLQLGGNSVWESFQQPSDTFLSSMRLTDNKKTGKNVRITSWVSPSDPTVGRFSAGIDSSNIPQFFTWKDNHPYWRSGPWSGQVFIGIPLMKSTYLNGFTVAVVEEGDGTVWLRYSYENDSWLYSITLGYDGRLIERYSAGNGSLIYSKGYLPDLECDVYGKCGEFGICNSQNSPICSCLQGFEPRAADDWNKGNWSSGCVKRAALQCERVENGSENRNEDGFLRLKMVKVPDYAQWLSTSSEQDCWVQCLKNCSCKAYAYYSGFGCMIWTSNLIDTQQFSNEGTDLYIRLADSEFDSKGNEKVFISIPAVIGAIAMCICAFLLWRWRTKHRRNKQKIQAILRSNDNGANTSSVEGKMTGHSLDHHNIRELPLFTLKLLATATDNFDESNKLGKGGFGPVYKGNLQNGQEIAVKRLSRASGQGLEEFMNEVEVISKLQHRNLVRLFGCCTEGDEKMLVYEYMPNKSLDALLFDTHKKELLGWRKRFNIIEGVCRGLLYLYRDSRLKIIHRDLKASNILLDQEFNPKILDFGMARIFGGNEDQADTTRIVGTYGYMAPEYAIEGRFS